MINLLFSMVTFEMCSPEAHNAKCSPEATCRFLMQGNFLSDFQLRDSGAGTSGVPDIIPFL